MSEWLATFERRFNRRWRVQSRLSRVQQRVERQLELHGRPNGWIEPEAAAWCAFVARRLDTRAARQWHRGVRHAGRCRRWDERLLVELALLSCELDRLLAAHMMHWFWVAPHISPDNVRFYGGTTNEWGRKLDWAGRLRVRRAARFADAVVRMLRSSVFRLRSRRLLGRRNTERFLNLLRHLHYEIEQLDGHTATSPKDNCYRALDLVICLDQRVHAAADHLFTETSTLPAERLVLSENEVRSLASAREAAARGAAARRSRRLLAAPLTEGPNDPNRFHWQGRQTELPPTPFALVKYLWGQPERTASEDRVASEVWGHAVTTNTIDTAKKVVNSKFLESRIPFTLRRKSGLCVIEVDGESEVRRA